MFSKTKGVSENAVGTAIRKFVEDNKVKGKPEKVEKSPASLPLAKRGDRAEE